MLYNVVELIQKENLVMKSSVFKTVAIVFAILGIIGGIVTGNQALDGFSFFT